MAFTYLNRDERPVVKKIVDEEGYTPIIAYENLPLNGETVDLIYVDMDGHARKCVAHFESDNFGNQRFIGETGSVKGNAMVNCVAWKHISY